MKKNLPEQLEFYGTTTLGDKGQLVIPVEVRNKFRLKKGEKLLVFSTPHNALVISKLADFQKLSSLMTKNLENISKVINTRSGSGHQGKKIKSNL